jgi:hypothetical protein
LGRRGARGTDIYLAVSGDGGAHFGDAVRVNDIEGDATASGERHLFDGGVCDIAVAHSTDDGRTFSSPVRVSPDNWNIDAFQTTDQQWMSRSTAGCM